MRNVIIGFLNSTKEKNVRPSILNSDSGLSLGGNHLFLSFSESHPNKHRNNNAGSKSQPACKRLAFGSFSSTCVDIQIFFVVTLGWLSAIAGAEFIQRRIYDSDRIRRFFLRIASAALLRVYLTLPGWSSFGKPGTM